MARLIPSLYYTFMKVSFTVITGVLLLQITSFQVYNNEN